LTTNSGTAAYAVSDITSRQSALALSLPAFFEIGQGIGARLHIRALIKRHCTVEDMDWFAHTLPPDWPKNWRFNTLQRSGKNAQRKSKKLRMHCESLKWGRGAFCASVKMLILN
jgi:hypothetical protein